MKCTNCGKGSRHGLCESCSRKRECYLCKKACWGRKCMDCVKKNVASRVTIWRSNRRKSKASRGTE